MMDDTSVSSKSISLATSAGSQIPNLLNFLLYYFNCGSSRSKHVGKFCPTAHLANVSILLRQNSLNSCWLIFKFYVPDDVSCRTGKENETRVIRNFKVRLENIGGDVVVGGQSAQKFRSRKKKGILCENE